MVTALTAETAVNVCYYTNWAQYRPDGGMFKPDKIDPHLCTHINYAFAFVNPAGTDLVPYEWNDVSKWGTSMYAEVNAMKEQNPDLKVLLSVGGWTHGTGGFGPAARTSNTRRVFAKNALAFIVEYDFDGIDIDWEYPAFTGHPTKPGTQADVTNYVALLEELKNRFQPAGLLVTAAVGAPPSRVDTSYPDTARICEALDMVHLMTYDMHGGWESVIGHHSPFTSDGNHPNDLDNNWNVKSSVDYWIASGCPAKKLTLGLGAYGRVFKATTSVVDRLAPGTAKGVKGTYTREDGYMSYYEICNWDSHIDSATQSAVATKGNLWAGFETVASANVKLDYLIEKGMAGVMWWTLDLDDFDGTFCGNGKYPLISGVWKNLQKKLGGHPIVSPTTTTTTTSTSTQRDGTAPTSGNTTTRGTTISPIGTDINGYCQVKGDGLWRSPTSCSKYVQCAQSGAIAVERECVGGLVWNSVKMYCDWKSAIEECTLCDCNETRNSLGTTVKTVKNPITTEVPVDLSGLCPKRFSGYAAYPGDCGRFVQCHGGRTFIKTCPAGTVWNSKINNCDWPRNVPSCN